MYTIALDCIVISFERFNNFQDLLWNFKFGKLDDVTQRVVRLNGKNTWNKEIIFRKILNFLSEELCWNIYHAKHLWFLISWFSNMFEESWKETRTHR